MRYFVIFVILLSFSLGDNLSVRLENLIKNKQDKKVIFLNYNPFPITKKEKKSTENNSNVVYRKKTKLLNFVTVINDRAFVNGRWLKVGDKIDGYRLEKIYSDKIIVNKRGVKTTLSLGMKQNILKIRENKYEN